MILNHWHVWITFFCSFFLVLAVLKFLEVPVLTFCTNLYWPQNGVKEPYPRSPVITHLLAMMHQTSLFFQVLQIPIWPLKTASNLRLCLVFRGGHMPALAFSSNLSFSLSSALASASFSFFSWTTYPRAKHSKTTMVAVIHQISSNLRQW